MQEVKVLAILSFLYITILSLITVLNLINKENYITRIIHSRFTMDTKSVLFYSFILSLIGTLGSLYLSEIKDLEPCKYCWFERILLFPRYDT